MLTLLQFLIILTLRMKNNLHFIFFSICLLFAGATGAQEFNNQFKLLITSNDTAAQRKLLGEWESKSPNDADLIMAWFNYYAGKSKKVSSNLAENPKNKSTFSIHDVSDKSQSAVQYRNEYDVALLSRAYACIDKGISTYPSRLDMRFAKIYYLGETKDFKSYTDAILATVAQSKTIRNTWLWTGDVPQAGAKDFLLTTVQEYIMLLYNQSNSSKNERYEEIRKISEKVLSCYPQNVESMNNLALLFLLQKKHKKAIPILQDAEKLAPDDFVVLNNLAQAYKRKGDKAKAIAYFEKVVKFGDAETTEFAKKELLELKKN